MIDYPVAMRGLISALKKLPSVGPRSAERLALFLVESSGGETQALQEALVHAAEGVGACPECGFFTEKGEVCEVCRQGKEGRRDGEVICVVERAHDVMAFERSESFRGLYHVLGGTLSPLDGVEPEDLRIQELMDRVKREGVEEVILGLGTDVKGETTSHYVAGLLRELGVKVSRLATGVSVGGSLEYADGVTLGHALKDRRVVE